RRFAGTVAARKNSHGASPARADVVEGYDVANGNLQLRLENVGGTGCQFTIVNAYDPKNVIRHSVRGGDNDNLYLDLRNAHGWYDLAITVDSDASFARRLAGHVETGKSSMSDPALGS
ncbi:phospholipase domain-containing protein, partial [Paraburkholderia sp.]|uniref:phospholipase domain-containing protein n=1 Tax=Paraburkholderia sp. TaxID=1926495 RepID=UPI002F42B292